MPGRTGSSEQAAGRDVGEKTRAAQATLSPSGPQGDGPQGQSSQAPGPALHRPHSLTPCHRPAGSEDTGTPAGVAPPSQHLPLGHTHASGRPTLWFKRMSREPDPRPREKVPGRVCPHLGVPGSTTPTGRREMATLQIKQRNGNSESRVEGKERAGIQEEKASEGAHEHGRALLLSEPDS